MELDEIKDFLNVYDSVDDKYIELIKNAVLDEFKELIPKFNRENMTSRQKLLLLFYIQEFYDNRSLYANNRKKMRSSISGMILNEKYRGDKI